MKDWEHYVVISSTQNSSGHTSHKMMTEVAQELLIILGNCKLYDGNIYIWYSHIYNCSVYLCLNKCIYKYQLIQYILNTCLRNCPLYLFSFPYASLNHQHLMDAKDPRQREREESRPAIFNFCSS